MLKKIKNHPVKLIIIISSSIFFVLLILLWNYLAIHQNKIYPNVFVSGVNVGSLTKESAVQKLEQKYSPPKSVFLNFNDSSYEISLDNIGFSYQFDQSVNNAFSQYRKLSGIYSVSEKLKALFSHQSLSLVFNIDKDLLDQHLSVIAGEASIEPQYPKILLTPNGLSIFKGVKGNDFNKDDVKKLLFANLESGNFDPITVVLNDIDPTITDEEANNLMLRAENLVNKSIIISYKESINKITGQELLDLIAPNNKYNNTKINELSDSIAKTIDQQAQSPVFVYKDGRVQEFSPAEKGIETNTEKLAMDISSALSKIENDNLVEVNIEVPTTEVDPPISTEEVNNLGIKELIGKGTSKFRGSITPRIYNIGVGSKKFDGVLIPPGNVFSFNDTIGDVSTLTGYKQAYIIKDGKTVLGDGGGVCQVSTTLFRAALDAGLPIIERRAHTYRVSYYELDSYPGLDATVYSPTTDFKFKNDTPGYILIQTMFDSENGTLEFELYGTSDGRVATTTKPVIAAQSPPPEDLYIDDPNLPEGTIKQTEHAAWGAKVQFDYKVVRNGDVLQDKTFYSNYKPWQAVYFRGTGPAS